MNQVVLFKTDDGDFPIEIIEHQGKKWVTRTQLANALGVIDLVPLHLRLLQRGEIQDGKHFTEGDFNTKEGMQNQIIYSYRGIIRISMHSEGKRTKIFRDRAENVLYEVMVTGSYPAGKNTGNVIQIYNFNSLADIAEEDSKLERMFRKRRKGLMQIGFEKGVAVRKAIASIYKDTGIDLAERLGVSKAELEEIGKSEPEYKDTPPKSETVPMVSSAPKAYRGWNLNKRGKSRNGEEIFNLVKKIDGKRYQKYLGAWNQKKADQIIDEMSQNLDN